MTFDRYAQWYDLIYRDKDYKTECDFIEEIFQNYSEKSVRAILDGMCGTGGHAIILAKRGYELMGIDASEVMIETAEKKRKQAKVNIAFHVMDLRQFNLNKRFDAAICMFAGVDYLPQTQDILKTLSNIRRHLEKDSLFVFDFWNGLAVLRILPSTRIKTVEDGGRRIIRITQPALDAFHHLCHVHYHLLVTQDNALIDEFEETHTVRYFFPQEMAHYLEDAGFEVLKICPFLDLEGKVDENVWNIVAIAKAI